MDFNTIDGRMDFFLLLLSTDRISRLKTRKGFSQSEFNLHLQLTCDKEPKIDQDIFLIDLFDKGYIVRGAYGDGLPPELTKEGYEFIMSGGFSERERKRLLELKKDEKLSEDLRSVKRTNKWFIVHLIITILMTAIAVTYFLKYMTKKQEVKKEEPNTRRQNTDTTSFLTTQTQPADSTKPKTSLP